MPIVPMLDLTFQLLFFFVVNFHPADLEGQMDMSLPSEEQHPAPVVVVERAADPQLPDFPADWSLRVRARLDDGSISAITVRNPAGQEVSVDDLAGLTKYLADKRKAFAKQTRIKVAGDATLKVKNLLEVIDRCRKAGISNVQLGTAATER
jgi:biopolymer transport protein ExbD